MTTSSNTRRIVPGLVAGFLMFAASIAPAFAAESVQVQLEGERGGKMAITLNQDSIPAGEVTFQVVNMATGTPHEMIVVMIDAAGQEFVVGPDTDKVDEATINSLGEVSGLKAGETGDLTLTLEPGNYKLICNLKGHYAAGMAVAFTVTGA